MPGKILSFLILCAACILVGSASLQDNDKDKESFVRLFNGKDLAGFWMRSTREDQKTFTVEEGGILHVAPGGGGGGLLRTNKVYKNYVLRFDWKFPSGGNSGCFVHLDPDKGGRHVEVQGLEENHGHMYGYGNFTTDKEAQKKAIKIGDWNTTEIISSNGKLISKVNGIQISTGKANHTEGQIGFQCEGAHVFFKNILIKELD